MNKYSTLIGIWFAYKLLKMGFVGLVLCCTITCCTIKSKCVYVNFFWFVLVEKQHVPVPITEHGKLPLHPFLSFVCLFVCLGSSVPFENFHSFGNITITGEGLQIFTCSRQSWPLSSEGSLTCHTYCNTGQLFIMVISEDQQPSHLLPSVWQWSCNYILKDLGLSQLGRTLYFYATTTV